MTSLAIPLVSSGGVKFNANADRSASSRRQQLTKLRSYSKLSSNYKLRCNSILSSNYKLRFSSSINRPCNSSIRIEKKGKFHLTFEADFQVLSLNKEAGFGFEDNT